jgi:hypothetical protein
VGVCPILELHPSPSKGHLSLRVRSRYVIPKDSPLAVIPIDSALGSHSWLDRDRTYLFPTVEELRSCLQRCGHEELFDVVGSALLLSLHCCLESIPKRYLWSSRMQEPVSTRSSEDEDLFHIALTEIHKSLCEVVTLPRMDIFESSAKYVLAALVDLSSADGSEDAVSSTIGTSVVVPLLDSVANKFNVPSNVALRRMSCADVRALRSDGFALFGCGQGLCGAPTDSQYWALVSIDEIQGGQELSLDQPFPAGDSSLWSPLERLRLGAYR